MPDRLREAFAFNYGEVEQHTAAKALRRLPALYRRIPTSLRYVGPYHEACARLQHCPIGLLTRANNRFWMGRSKMLSPDQNHGHDPRET
jgi:hypothetical protein